MEVEELKELLRKSWSSETSAVPDDWTPENPAWGQCAVSARIFYDCLGGEIVRGDATIDNIIYSHYWNRLNGQDFDLTKEQFPPGTSISERLIRPPNYVFGSADFRKRYALLRLRVENLINPNPLFADPLYQMCLATAMESECQKMKFGCLILHKPPRGKGKIIAAANKVIEPLRDMCTPECIRFKIQSRTESMIGACGHAEETAVWAAIKLGLPLEKCSLYIAGFDAKNSKPWIKKEKVHTCLRCAVQMFRAGIGQIYVPVIDHWESLTPRQTLKTAKEYALKEKIITEQAR